MGLLGAFVVRPDRRGVLAALAITASVAYSLVAGAAATGLQTAQETLSPDVQDVWTLVTRPDARAFADASLPRPPDHAILSTTHEGRTYYAVVPPDGPAPAPGRAWAGPASGLAAGANLQILGQTVIIEQATRPPGARTDAIGLPTELYYQVDPGPRDRLSVALYKELSPAERARLEQNGFAILQAPSVVPFYVEGAKGLAEGVTVAVLASTLVVSLLSASFVLMEIRSRRAGLATLRFYAGTPLVILLIVARGLVLLLAAHISALIAVQGLLYVLRRAQETRFALTSEWLALAFAATLGGGVLGILAAALRATRKLEAHSLAEETRQRARPRILRPILSSWPTVVPLAVAAFVLAASLGVILGGAAIPNQIFGARDTNVVAVTTGNPLRGRIDAFLGEHLSDLERYEAASAEIFAPTVIRGTPVLVRGVEWTRLTGLDPIRLEEGRPPQALQEAVVADRLSRLLGLHVGETVLAPSPYTPSVVPLRIVGRASGPGLLNDEIFTNHATARALTDLGPEHVTLIRYRHRPLPDEAAATRPEIPSALEVTQPRLVPENPVPNEPVELTVTILNFDAQPRGRVLTVRANDVPVADAWVELAPHSIQPHTFRFRAPAQGLARVTVNPTLDPDAAPPAYRIEAPDRALTGSDLRIRVTDFQDRPKENVAVRIDAATARTDSDGRATLRGTENGNRTLVATGDDGRAARGVFLVHPADQNVPRIRIHEVTGPRRAPPGDWPGVALAENVGGQPFEGPLTAIVNGEDHELTTYRLAPGQLQRVPFALPLDNGTYLLSVGAINVPITVQPPELGAPGSELTIEQLLEKRRAAAAQAAENRGEATQAFLGDTYTNLNAALVLIVLATVLHAGLIALVTTQRETEQRQVTLGVLIAVGADVRQLRRRTLLDHLLPALVAAASGTLLGLGFAWTAAELGIITAFGHAILPRLDPEFILRLVAVSLGTTLGAALIALEVVRNRELREILVQGPRRQDRPTLQDLLGEAR